MKKSFKDKQGICLDLGGGSNPNPGYVNIDILDLPEVDIVHDLETFPWPLEDESVIRVIASHILEHINPHKGVFINVMNEVWRVMKPGGQFAIAVPHAESKGYYQDPTHCNPINEMTMHYFDPDPEMQTTGPGLYNFYKPKPWKIIQQYFNADSNLEILLVKRRMDFSYLRDTKYPSLEEKP